MDVRALANSLTMDEALIIRFGCELLEAPKIGDETYKEVRT